MKIVGRKYLVLISLITACINGFAQQIIPLYTDSIPNSIGRIKDADKPVITAYFPAKEKNNHCAILIFPGGAYSFWAFKEEGTTIAEELVQRGFAAFVVKYRLPND